MEGKSYFQNMCTYDILLYLWPFTLKYYQHLFLVTAKSDTKTGNLVVLALFQCCNILFITYLCSFFFHYLLPYSSFKILWTKEKWKCLNGIFTKFITCRFQHWKKKMKKKKNYQKRRKVTLLQWLVTDMEGKFSKKKKKKLFIF